MPLNYSDNVHSPYISINFGTVNLTWRASEDRPDFFTSLTHKRVIDQANTTKINISYTPSKLTDLNQDDYVNKVEKAIVDAGGECFFEYGDYGQVSPLYRGLVINYSVSFSEGSLEYSFDLISKIAQYNFNSLPGGYVSLKSYAESSDPDYRAQAGRAVRTYIESKVYPALSDSYNLDASALEGAEPLIIPSLYDSNDSDDSQYRLTYNAGLSPIQIIRFLISKLVKKGNNSFSYFTVVVDDTVRSGVSNVSGSSNGALSVSRGLIKVVEVSTVQNVSNELVFEWGTKDGTVVDWRPSFNGSIAIFSHRGDLPSAYNYFSLLNPNTGKINISRAAQGSLTLPNTMSTSINSQLSASITSLSEFKSLTNYCYNGTLTVLGRLDAVELAQSKLRIVPLIYGQPHHSEGVYIITSVEDSISSDGMTTTYEVQRASYGDTNLLYNKYLETGELRSDYDIYDGNRWVPVVDIPDNYQW